MLENISCANEVDRSLTVWSFSSERWIGSHAVIHDQVEWKLYMQQAEEYQVKSYSPKFTSYIYLHIVVATASTSP